MREFTQNDFFNTQDKLDGDFMHLVGMMHDLPTKSTTTVMASPASKNKAEIGIDNQKSKAERNRSGKDQN